MLDVAERLAQSRGFNAFSYADVAAELGVPRAALHYHFAGKAELGEALLARYAARFADALDAIDAEPMGAPAKLAAYADLYLDLLRRDQMCLCGMLAADYQTLPERMQCLIVRFFNDHETWLTKILGQGEHEATIHIRESADEVARTIVMTLEGALLVARPFHDTARFQAAATSLVTRLTSK